MKTAKKRSALLPFCAVLSAVFCFLAAFSFFLYTLQVRHGGDFNDPVQRTQKFESLLDVYDEPLRDAFRVYYRSEGTAYADCPEALLPQNTNLRLIARDAQTGALLLRTAKTLPQGDDALLHETVLIPVTYTVGNDYLVEKTNNASVEYYLPAVLTVEDCFYTESVLLRAGQAAESYLWSGGIVLSALTALFAGLFLHSARREGTLARSRRRLFRELPADFLLVVLLPFLLLCASRLHTSDTRLLLLHVLTSRDASRLFEPAAGCAGLLFGLLWIAASALFSLQAYGRRGLLTYCRYENAPFTRCTLPVIAVLQAVKIAVYLLYAVPHPRAIVVFLAVEKIVTLPVLYRCLREIRAVSEDTQAVALGDLSHPIGSPRMIRSIRDHADDIARIAERISVSADEYIRSGQFKAELITNLSHDIKTPLTSIINYAALLQDESLPEQDRQRYTAVLHRHAQRMSRLVEDLTQVSDTQSGRLEAHCERVDLVSLTIQAAMGFEERLQKQNIAMRFSVPETPVFVWADSRLLWRVVDNLMNNICKYTMPDTDVHISVMSQDGTAHAVFENTPASPLEKSGDALMERFVRADNSRHTEGSGLGLSIARSLIELQSGTLHIETEPSRFTAAILLPEKE